MYLTRKRLRSGFAAVAFFGSLSLAAWAATPSAFAKQAADGSGLVAPCSPVPPMYHPIRIGILTRASHAYIALYSPGAVFINNQPVALLEPRVVYMFSPGRMTNMKTGVSTSLPVDARAQVASQDLRVWTGNRWWRGSLEIMAVRGGMTVVNLLDLEEYLQGVVPSEMPSSWKLEALKAQAVAARSYAWAHMGPGSKWYRSEGYDLVPDVRDQAYKGLAAEAPSTTAAVMQTFGQILKDANRVKAGFYRAWVGDSWETNLNIRHKQVTNSSLEKMTGVTQILGVTVKQYDSSFNARAIQVIGAKNTREVDGLVLAKMLGLSTGGILDIHQENGTWLITYRGPGNGVLGLSQHGANELAKKGWQYFQILQLYYQDADGQVRLIFIDRPTFTGQVVPTAQPAQAKPKDSSDSSDSGGDKTDKSE